MSAEIKENVKNVDVWIRGLFIVIFGVILYFLFGLIWLLVVFQFLTKVITGNLNQNLSNFSAGLTEYAFQILLYITFQSEERPFPFSPWPSGEGVEATEKLESSPASESGQEQADDKPEKED